MEFLYRDAKTVFNDPLYVNFYDPDHSRNEERYLVIRASNRDRLLMVSYARRNGSIRLISARTVTRTERKIYEEG